jgi:hypothetical protein
VLPEGADPKRDFSRIRVELPKEQSEAAKPGDMVSISIEPNSVMLLRK